MKGFGDLYRSKKKINQKTKQSKEQIINKAFQFHQQGNISEAAKYYQIFINRGFSDERVFSNYGNILRDLGKLKEAAIYHNKAIEINPHFANAHLNLGNILRDLGKLKEAEISYGKAIEINPDFAMAHCNLGNILRDLGKLKEAEICHHKAIEINPHLANAHLNLGNILRDLGKLKEAEISYGKAIEINPDFAMAHCNLGNIFSDLGKLKEAEISYGKAIEINPHFANAHLNLGNILSDNGKLQEAFNSFLKVIEINPTFSNVYPSLTRFLQDSDLSELNKSNLKQILTNILERTDVSHKELFKAFNFLYKDELLSNCEALDSDFFSTESLLNDKLVILALKKIIFSDLKLEVFLRKIRRQICDLIAKNKKTINYSALDFIIALGEQCFFNEYIYSITEDEKKCINKIINRCIDGELNEINISILSCYYPLYKLINQIPSLESFTSFNPSFNELIKLQIKEPLKEIKLSQNIKKIGSINDNVSLKVRSQYEENPYPRWRYGNDLGNQKISLIQGINDEIKPNYISQSLDNKQLKIMIAGCGTGNQILQAHRYKNAQITAIDLSLSSLSYAQRKINELGINNVELIQMDILEVQLLKEKFDIIECGGVLHHMDDPSIGLTNLLGILKNDGFLKLGLYSELARQDIIKARNYITSKNLQSSEDNIRHFRDTLFSGKIPELNSLLESGDLYTLSSCLDLCFHAQEYRFTIKQIQNIIISNKLKFLGFSLPKQLKSQYKNYFPEDKKQTNLQNWLSFEEKNPKTFGAMYQFWVSKKKN